MKTSSSWNRRRSEVAPNGYFTVLKSGGWFPTFRLPEGFRYLTGKSVINPSHPVGVVARVIFSDPSANAPAPTETTIALQQIESGRVGLRGVLRIAAMALIAMALTFAALLWIMHTTQLTPRT